ncbi:hypothetical protein H0194_08880 [Corynebacterium incognita]|uniref:Uncharacterized protein n=1 Tax=Corynebacterium incognita TaxID=2754725 RepID=A0A7G7CNJ7_9CORY|nr:HEPN domain-containing protein [Corynebacterium incognita]QNE89163.1 hypothetical protein H0194_08880 [Corynebacterium incognita]
MSSFNIDTPHQWKGRWQVLGSDEWLTGTLEWVPEEGFTLDLFEGAFEDFFLRGKTESKFMPGATVDGLSPLFADNLTVFGNTTEGEVSLFGVSCLSKESNMFAEMSARYSCDNAVIGLRVSSLEEDVVRRATISVEGLHYLLGGPKTFELSREFTDDRDSPFFAALKLRKTANSGPVKLIGVDEIAAVEHNSTLRSNRWSPTGYSGVVEETCILTLHSDNCLSLIRLRHHRKALSWLISLIAKHPMRITSTNVTRDPVASTERGELVQLGLSKTGSKLDWSKRLDFAFHLEHDEFLNLYQRWLHFTETKGRLIGLLNELSLPNNNKLEMKVLLSGVLIEAFHKELFRKPDTISPDGKRKFEELYPNENIKVKGKFVFKARALDIYCRLPKKISHDLIPDVKDWLDSLTDLRNSIAHEAQVKDSDFVKAIAVFETTRLLVELLLWHILEVDEEKLVEAKKNHSTFYRARQKARKAFPHRIPNE